MVAGLGNMLIQDDGFGTEVIRRLRSINLPPQVEVEDFGINGVRMAHRLIEGYDLLVIADIAKRGGEPGTVYLIEIDPTKEQQFQLLHSQPNSKLMSSHTMGSEEVFSLISSFGTWPKKVVLVCCEPLFFEEYAIGLSEPVQKAVDKATEVIRSIITDELGKPASS